MWVITIRDHKGCSCVTPERLQFVAKLPRKVSTEGTISLDVYATHR